MQMEIELEMGKTVPCLGITTKMLKNYAVVICI